MVTAVNEEHRGLIAELERRIHEMELHAEETFGDFARRDWILCTLIGLVIPVAVLLACWP